MSARLRSELEKMLKLNHPYSRGLGFHSMDHQELAEWAFKADLLLREIKEEVFDAESS
jgi:hypothetical protein